MKPTDIAARISRGLLSLPVTQVSWMARLLVFVWLAGAGVVTAQGSPGPASLATRFVDAWNEHDRAGFAALLAADADWVTASGVRLRGREAIVDFLADEHAGWARHTRMRVTDLHVRTVNVSTAAIFFEWEITDASDSTGAGPSARRGNNLFIVARAGPTWTIVAGQVARKVAPSPVPSDGGR